MFYELIHVGVFNKFSDLYIRLKSIQVNNFNVDIEYFVAQISLRKILEEDPAFDFLGFMLTRIDKFTDRLSTEQKMLVLDLIFQKLFYDSNCILGNHCQFHQSSF